MAQAALLVTGPAGFVVLWRVRAAAFGSGAGGGFLVHALLVTLSASLAALFVPGFVVLGVTVVFRSSRVALGMPGSSVVSSALFFVFLRKTFTFCTTARFVSRCAFWIFCEDTLSSLTTLCATGFADSRVFCVGHAALWVSLAVGRSLRAVKPTILTAKTLGRVVIVCRASFATGSIVVALIGTTLAFLRVRLASASECAEDATNDSTLLHRIGALHRGRPVNEGEVVRSGCDSCLIPWGVDHDRFFIAECSRHVRRVAFVAAGLVLSALPRRLIDIRRIDHDHVITVDGVWVRDSALLFLERATSASETHDFGGFGSDILRA
jgi:hypothetical protein